MSQRQTIHIVTINRLLIDGCGHSHISVVTSGSSLEPNNGTETGECLKVPKSENDIEKKTQTLKELT